jgi:hypothetical protein
LAFDGKSPRTSLAPVISGQLAVRRATEDLTVPMCAQTAKAVPINYMDAEINA